MQPSYLSDWDYDTKESDSEWGEMTCLASLFLRMATTTHEINLMKQICTVTQSFSLIIRSELHLYLSLFVPNPEIVLVFVTQERIIFICTVVASHC